MKAGIDVDEFTRFCGSARAAMDLFAAEFSRMRDDFEAAIRRLENAISDLGEAKKPKDAPRRIWNWKGLETLRELPRNFHPRQNRVEVAGRLSRGAILGSCVASAVLSILIDRELATPGEWTKTLDVSCRAREMGFQQSKTFKDFLFAVAGRGRVLASVGLVERLGSGAGGSLRIAPGALDTIKAFGPDVGLFISNSAVGRSPQLAEVFERTLEERRSLRGGTT